MHLPYFKEKAREHFNQRWSESCEEYGNASKKDMVFVLEETLDGLLKEIEEAVVPEPHENLGDLAGAGYDLCREKMLSNLKKFRGEEVTTTPVQRQFNGSKNASPAELAGRARDDREVDDLISSIEI